MSPRRRRFLLSNSAVSMYFGTMKFLWLGVVALGLVGLALGGYVHFVTLPPKQDDVGLARRSLADVEKHPEARTRAIRRESYERTLESAESRLRKFETGRLTFGLGGAACLGVGLLGLSRTRRR